MPYLQCHTTAVGRVLWHGNFGHLIFAWPLCYQPYMKRQQGIVGEAVIPFLRWFGLSLQTRTFRVRMSTKCLLETAKSLVGRHADGMHIVSPRSLAEINTSVRKIPSWEGVAGSWQNELYELWLALYHRNGNKWECISNKVQVRGISADHKKVWEYRQTDIVYEAK